MLAGVAIGCIACCCVALLVAKLCFAKAAWRPWERSDRTQAVCPHCSAANDVPASQPPRIPLICYKCSRSFLRTPLIGGTGAPAVMPRVLTAVPTTAQRLQPPPPPPPPHPVLQPHSASTYDPDNPTPNEDGFFIEGMFAHDTANSRRP